MPQPSDFSYQEITSASFSDSSRTTTVLQKILTFSNNEVFNVPNDPKFQTHHSSLPEWTSRLTLNEAAVLFYFTATNTTTSGSTNNIGETSMTGPPNINKESKVVGYIFAHPRHLSEDETQKKTTYHVWLAGVDPEVRGKGVFRKLMAKVENHAYACGYQDLTIATFPEKFERMAQILRSEGWHKLEREHETNGQGKIIFAKKIVREVVENE